MTNFIKLTQVTKWKIEDDKRSAVETKDIYVRPCDIVSFEEDNGYTVVAFREKGICVKEKPEEIFKMINKKEEREFSLNDYLKYPYKDRIFLDGDFWWDTPFKATWTDMDALNTLAKSTPYYGTAIIFSNGEVWD
jgi:hypothetical protein